MQPVMTLGRLALRGTVYYWRTNAAVVAGVACAVAVLAGALVVGDSVRASLRELAVGRLGRADVVVASPAFFREGLAADLAGSARAAAPLIVADGLVVRESSGSRAGGVAVYGIDDRFFAFHGIHDRRSPAGADAFLSPALASDLGASEDDVVLLRTRKPSAIPAEFLHGRRDEVGRTMRLRVAGVLPGGQLGEFSLRPQQGAVRAVFVPLARLQRDLDRPREINTVLVSSGGASDAGAVERMVRDRASLADVGLRVRPLDRPTTLKGRATAHALAVESRAALLDETAARAALDAARERGWTASPLFTYLANAIRIGDRQVPYSLVTAMDFADLAGLKDPPYGRRGESIVLNAWTARELKARIGDEVTLDYYVWETGGGLVTKSAPFRLAAIVPVTAADRDYAPDYPGITESADLSDWDPPFPLDLKRIRRADEEYWDRYRTTPKAFVRLEAGQALWRTRYGQLTSVRIAVPAAESLENAARAFERALRPRVDPLLAGVSVVAVRSEALRASTGATDFGEYFSYFSFFIVVSALLLAALFFRLGVEQRLREIGTLRAIGYPLPTIRRLFLLESVSLGTMGAALGALGALAYAAVIMLGLRTWWVGAVGTTLLALHPSWQALAAGAAGGVMASMAAIAWTLRALRRASPRALLSGDVGAALGPAGAGRLRWTAGIALALTGIAVAAVVAGAAEVVPDAGAFFLAGASLVGAGVAALSARLAAGHSAVIDEAGWRGVARLGVRYATWRRGRSVLSVALIASAVFLIVSIDAFRKEPGGDAGDPRAGTGGFALVAESILPIFDDPSSPQGREALNLEADVSGSAGLPYSMHRLRLRPGDDASCLNLYRPQRPRIVGAPMAFIESGRFSFSRSLASSVDERANPWRLLERAEPDGAIPAIVDATSLQYVLHLSLGDELMIDEGGRTIRLRIVGALADSLFQGEVIIAESRFVEAFPAEEGYRYFLIDVRLKPDATGDVRLKPDATGNVAAGDRERVAAFLEERLADFGFDATSAPERLAAFHRVENTYLSTFQALGALGLLLGTIGLAAVAVRNVLERRRELALLRAVGYDARNVRLMIVAEHAWLVAAGLAIGLVSALVAIAPAAARRGGGPGGLRLIGLVALVAAAGLLSSAVAARVAVRAPLVPALRSE